MESEINKKLIKKIAIWVGIFILVLILNPLKVIGPGTRGVVIRVGAIQDRILEEGIHWVTPILYSVEKMDVTIQKEEKSSSASSDDMQTVTSKVAINYHLDPLRVNKLYQEMKRDYSSIVISPAIEEFVKKTTAQYTAEELITKRENVKQDLKLAISENLANRYIIVDDIFMTDFNFSDEFNRSIEAKVTAEQRALEEKNKTVQVEEQKKQTILRAEAEAEAIKIQASAINSQGGKDYVALKAVEKWDGVLPVQMIPDSVVPFIDLTR